MPNTSIQQAATVRLAEHLATTRNRGDLAAYAAVAALSELHLSWVAAIGDGFDPRDLLRDIDEVKQRLDEHRERLTVALSLLHTPAEGYRPAP